MIGVLRKIARLLESARLATWLLVFVGAWSVVATLVPQGDAVASWAAAHPTLDVVVRILDLHHAFTALVFVAAVFLLAISTALCAWTRTKVALRRTRALRAARTEDGSALVAKHDLEIECDSRIDSAEILSSATRALEGLGIRTKQSGNVLRSVSPWWSVWGSPLFHWGLLALMVAVLIGSLQRSDGLMGVAVGQTVPDQPESYGVLHAGPLHSWSSVHRSIRVDAFDTDYRTGNIDRGPTPTVSVLDAQGRVLKTQHIFPNSPLQTGTLTVHPAAFGFAVDLSLLDKSGVEFGHTTKLVDVVESAPQGTEPVGGLTISNRSGQQQDQAVVTVPLTREGDHFVVPDQRTARVVVGTLAGKVVADRVLKPGESIALPSGDTLRVDRVGFYARLSVVDDGSIPYLYAAMAIAVIGLALTLIARQQSVLVTSGEGADGAPRLFASVRLWRNVPTNRNEVQTELARVLGGNDKGSES